MVDTGSGFFIWLQITLASFDGSSTRTVYVSNRQTQASDNVLPVLLATSGLDIRTGAYIPEAVSASVTLDNTPGSMGSDRRFSDLFERETPIDQQVIVKIARADSAESISVASGGTTFVTTLCKGWSLDGEKLTLELGNESFDRKYFGRPARLSEFPNLPDRSIGKTFPIVFADSSASGPAQVRAVQIADDSTPTYGYATTLTSEHPVGGVTQYYVKNRSGDYVPCKSVATTAEVSGTFPANPTGAKLQYEVSDGSGIAMPFDYDVSADSAILTGGRIRGRGNNAGSTVDAGELIFKLLAERANGEPDIETVYGVGRIQKADYDGIINAASSLEFWFNFAFDEPVILPDSNQTLYLYIQSVDEGYSVPELCRFLTEADSGASFYSYFMGGASGEWTAAGGINTYRPYFRFFGLEMTDTKSSSGDSDGFGAARFELTQNSMSGWTGQTNPDLTSLDFIVDIDGLKDDSSGSITGSANAQIIRPDHAVKLLSQTYNGSSWGAIGVSSSEYASELNALYTSLIYLSGSTRGRETVYSIIEEICRNSAMRIFNRASGLELYAEGTEQTSKARITDAHARNVSITSTGADQFVINRAETFCNRKYRNADVITGTSEGQFADYYTTVKIDDSTGGKWDEIRGESEDLFGARYVAKQTYDWLADTESLETTLEYLLRRYAYPIQTLRFEIPVMIDGAFATEALELDNGDVIDFVHPDVPAYFGTSSSAKTPSYDGALVESGGKHEKRARLVRAQIHSKGLSWAKDTAPALRFSCRIIGKSEVI